MKLELVLLLLHAVANVVLLVSLIAWFLRLRRRPAGLGARPEELLHRAPEDPLREARRVEVVSQVAPSPEVIA